MTPKIIAHNEEMQRLDRLSHSEYIPEETNYDSLSYHQQEEHDGQFSMNRGYQPYLPQPMQLAQQVQPQIHPYSPEENLHPFLAPVPKPFQNDSPPRWLDGEEIVRKMIDYLDI